MPEYVVTINGQDFSITAESDDQVPEIAAIIEKTQFGTAGQQVQAQPQPPTVQPQQEQVPSSIASQLATGAGKSVVSTLTGLGTLAQKGLRQVIPGESKLADIIGLDLDVADAIPKKFREPSTTAESFGFGGGEIMQFLIPGLKAEKFATGVISLIKGRGLSRVVDAGARMLARFGIEGSTAAGVSVAQTGGDKNAALITGAVGGAFPIIFRLGRGFLSKTAKFFKEGGEKIQTTIIRPGPKDTAGGFKISHVQKHKLGGTLEQTESKLNKTLSEKSEKMFGMIKETDQPVDMSSVFSDVEDKIFAGRGKLLSKFEMKDEALSKMFDKFIDIADDVTEGTGLISAENAQLWKQAAGHQGAWLHGTREVEQEAAERLYNALYISLKEHIEKVAPSGLKEINKEISELLSIKQAIMRRLPVEARNNVIPLSQLIPAVGAASARRFTPLAISAAAGISKSGKFANLLVNSEKRILQLEKRLGRGPERAGRVTTAGLATLPSVPPGQSQGLNLEEQLQ